MLPLLAPPQSWQLPGAENQLIFGDTHRPGGDPLGLILIAHGFKGYKDYGMFPAIAAASAAGGFIAHRFNFSHSGMTNETESFARPDLFELDTWNKQVADLRAVIEAVQRGELAGSDLPYVMFGHSRGGVSVLLATGRFADDAGFVAPVGVVTAAAPSQCSSLTREQVRQLQAEGSLESPSARTGQVLRIGRAFIQEQLDDPAAHDLRALVARIRCPLLIIHGANDPTVPAAAAAIIAAAATAPVQTLVVEGGDHVFNTPNPMPADEAPSPQLTALIEALIDFARAGCRGARVSR